MSGQDQDTDKQHEPTQHKLGEARKKGELARSADLTAAAGYTGVLLAATVVGAATTEKVGSALTTLIAQPDRLRAGFFDGAAQPVAGALAWAVGSAMLAWFLLPAALSLLAVIGTRSFVVTSSKLKPKAQRINPLSNAKQKYGPSGLFEFAKSFAKLLLYSGLLAAFLMHRLPVMAGALHAEPRGIGLLMVRQMIDFMLVVVPIALVIGGIDYAWQHFDHRRRNRMSHQEVKEEHKTQEGDPHMKQERRQRATEIASSRMMADVPGADVVIVNPTHYAVALRWSRAARAAPVCVAKGVDHIALAIREAAAEAGVPVRSDPPTARALHATTEIGSEIAPEHYRAVAAAIRFSDAIRKRAKAFG